MTDIDTVKQLIELLIANKIEYLKIGDIELKKSFWELPVDTQSTQASNILPSQEELFQDMELTDALSFYPLTRAPKTKK